MVTRPVNEAMSWIVRSPAPLTLESPMNHSAGPAVVKAVVMPACRNGQSSSENPMKKMPSQAISWTSKTAGAWPASTRSRRLKSLIGAVRQLERAVDQPVHRAGQPAGGRPRHDDGRDHAAGRRDHQQPADHRRDDAARQRHDHGTPSTRSDNQPGPTNSNEAAAGPARCAGRSAPPVRTNATSHTSPVGIVMKYRSLGKCCHGYPWSARTADADPAPPCPKRPARPHCRAGSVPGPRSAGGPGRRGRDVTGQLAAARSGPANAAR